MRTRSICRRWKLVWPAGAIECMQSDDLMWSGVEWIGEEDMHATSAGDIIQSFSSLDPSNQIYVHVA